MRTIALLLLAAAAAADTVVLRDGSILEGSVTKSDTSVAVAGDTFPGVLFMNPGSSARGLAVRLVGTRSNRAAIGARLRLQLEDNGVRRTIHRRVGEGSSWGARPGELWIGLGRAERVASLEVEWPSTGIRQVVRDIPADRRVIIIEGEPGTHRVE